MSKKCKACSQEFTATKPMQSVCCMECAIAWTRTQSKKSITKEQSKARRKLLDTDRGHWTKKAQAAFNAYIRLRDGKEPCISCGRHHTGQYHAGHYRPSVHSLLRFAELNVHKQCAPCNNHKSGNLVEYRIALIKKIGIDNVEALEVANDTKRWTVDELKQIEKIYKAKIIALRTKFG